MKHKGLFIISALVASIIAPELVSARENVGVSKNVAPPTINASCVEATAQSDLAVNNVRARVLMGDMWWDLAAGVYIVPKGGTVGAIFAGSLWIGGIDIGGQIKVAAQTYRQSGNDFWPGPLDTTNASVDFDVCSKYDKHFKITRKEVESFVSNGTSTNAIAEWPGNGTGNQGHYLAPFFDKDADGVYNPGAGDYPGYDLVAGDGYGECQQVNCIPVDQLFGDETLWWVFNDKGNIHGETGGEPIGLEIRAQAFAFFTDDDINNMTFYNYRIFNRSTYQVDSCYFGVWCDADLGDYSDDYVGCDVKRGIGYTYNGDNDDAISGGGYGLNPPAIGIDFFRGPIADVYKPDNVTPEGKDNDRNCQVDEPCEQIIMSGFLYYNNTNGVPNGNPSGFTHYYNYLKMKWGDGTPTKYGGDGYTSATGPVCQFMFPGNPTTDEHDWGVGGNCTTPSTMAGWDEVTAGNVPEDRRMLQSAGPFTLKPGALNVITTGVVWAKANSGGAQASVKLLQAADDKAQALFDNCFKVLDGPDAPDVTVQELDKELILYLSNTNSTSNNYNEKYEEFDPLIILLDTGGNTVPVDTTYNFQGYKVYQVLNNTVTGNDLDDAGKARLIAQSDIKDGVASLINFEFDQTLGSVPKPMVTGKDLGIAHSIHITQDAFAVGSPALVNHKTYYFLAVSYGYNEFKKYQEDTPPADDPLIPAYDGQKKPYKQGRKNIKVYSAIPHLPSPYSGGTEIHGTYGAGPMITRVEGNGNGRMNLEMTSASVNAILSSPDHRILTPTYEYGRGPVNIKVVDPLNVPDDNNFTLTFDSTVIADSKWTLTNNTTGEVVHSDKTIKAINEQLIMQWGLAVSIEQVGEPGSATAEDNGLITSSISFKDPSKKWLTGLADNDVATATEQYNNWIRSGAAAVVAGGFVGDYSSVDVEQFYEGVVGGTWAPYRLTACTYTTVINPANYYTGPGFKSNLMNQPQMADIASVNVVLTSDKSKWTRCVVLEMCEDIAYSENTSGDPTPARKLDYRRAPSVDKDGQPDGTGSGMGWFPGYAINLETGERLNIAFGENSALVNENGNDMKWNPTTTKYASTYNLPWDTVGQAKGGPVFGGQHYIYVFGHNKDNDPSGSPTPNDTTNVPRYDEGKRIREVLGWDNGNPVDAKKREVYRDAMWVNIPLLVAGHTVLESDVTVSIRVGKAYKKGYSSAYYTDGLTNISSDTSSAPQNGNLPMYTFNTDGIATHTGESEIAKEALDLINVVPNPYYAFSAYERNQADNRMKITNLPESCTVSIYNLNGTLIRKLKKGGVNDDHEALDSEVTSLAGSIVITTWDGSLDWDLKNTVGIPISSGVYIIHVEVPGVGEKVIKWFAVMRPIALDGF